MRTPSALVIATLALNSHALPSSKCNDCKSTQNFQGWDTIKHAFIFGDSYTQTGFNTTLAQPSPDNPLGNPAYPGWTSSNGPNWVDFLTVKYNASIVQTYNLAYGGATVDSDLVTPWKPTVLSLKDQVEDLFVPSYADSDFWASQDSVFGFWMGINDVGNSYYNGPNVSTPLNEKIFEVYSDLVDQLVDAGARNFFFINVPPVERSPLTIGQGEESVAMEKNDIKQFNRMIENMASDLKGKQEDANVWVYDSYKLFNAVLDDPSVHEQTKGYRILDEYCKAYENGTPEWDTQLGTCKAPVDQYFWLNSLHPTYPIHDVVAEGVSDLLKGEPNIC